MKTKFKIDEVVMTPEGRAKIKVIDTIHKAVRVEHIEARTPVTDYRFSDINKINY